MNDPGPTIEEVAMPGQERGERGGEGREPHVHPEEERTFVTRGGSFAVERKDERFPVRLPGAVGPTTARRPAVTAGELCSRSVVIARTEETAFTVAQRMRDEHVGDLVVVEPAPQAIVPVGIVTDRDLVLRVLAAGRSPETVRVDEVMTRPVGTVHEGDDGAAVLTAMKRAGARRMPVVDDRGSLVGILTLDDVIDWLAEQMTEVVSLFRQALRREVQEVERPEGRAEAEAAELERQ